MRPLLFLKASALFFTFTLFPDWQNNAWETRVDTWCGGVSPVEKNVCFPLVLRDIRS
ncbi:hypothetical protein NSP_9650 [Nodularia spumigena CCY9414]|nr:hypothetical protein NSP_9650 [Nodularia spumigena CCY9414]